MMRVIIWSLLLVLPGVAHAQSQAEGELNRAKAALQLRKYPEAAARFQKLAEAGDPVAQFYLGRMAATALGMPKDLPKAIHWWQRSAQRGYVESQAVLGFHYMQGLGVERNYAEAARWSRLAAERGHGGSAYNLAKLYREGGHGLRADPAEAEKWAKTAMAKGFSDPLQATPVRPQRSPEAVAMFDEGQRLFRAGDMAGAVRAFARCAQMGDASCQLQLGWHYEEGKGVSRNLGEAVKWYRAAAERNDPRAAGNLGNMYHFGRGVSKSCTAAVEWYARGALHKDHWSLHSLGRMYYFGFGVREDRAKAKALYRQAAAFGNHDAREALVTFNQFTFPDERSAAIYDERVRRYTDAINLCQAQANTAGHSVTCLVPGVDLNPQTWEQC